MNKKVYIILLIITVIAVSVFTVLQYKDEESSQQTGSRDVLLYFSTQNALYLKAESRTIANEGNIYINTMKELIKGPDTSLLNKTIPDNVKVLDIKINNKTARIDFNNNLKDNHWGGSTGERMTIYSIVNTLTQFEDINEVMILLEGEEIDTLAGHMDLTRPLAKNEEIIKE